MPDALIDRVTDDLAAGRSVNWTVVIASAATPAERRQLESLRLVHQMACLGNVSSETAAVADTAPVGPARLANPLATTQPVWGRYVLVHEAGAGSFGTVFR